MSCLGNFLLSMQMAGIIPLFVRRGGGGVRCASRNPNRFQTKLCNFRLDANILNFRATKPPFYAIRHITIVSSKIDPDPDSD